MTKKSARTFEVVAIECVNKTSIYLFYIYWPSTSCTRKIHYKFIKSDFKVAATLHKTDTTVQAIIMGRMDELKFINFSSVLIDFSESDVSVESYVYVKLIPGLRKIYSDRIPYKIVFK